MRNALAGGLVGLFFACLILTGCEAPSPRDYVAEDSARCANAGFAPGSAEMAQCMNTASRERTAEANRQAQKDAQAARASQQQQAQREADDAAWRASADAQNEQARKEAAAAMSGDPMDQGFTPKNGALGDDPDPRDDMRPTAASIPGMQCTGEGEEASCDALSSY